MSKTSEASATDGKTGWLGSWMRKVVPPGYQLAVLALNGTAPLLMNSGEYDPDGELYRSYYLLGQKKKKSLDDEARLRALEWRLRIQLDPELGPFIPGKNIKELLRQAATKWRKGEEIKRSLLVLETRIPLQYEGPRTEQELWNEGYRYVAMVKNAGAGSGSVRRCRPCFDKWALEAELAYDPEDLDFDFLGLVVERSQKYGLGDYRPTFGSFDAWLTKGELHKSGVRGNGQKARNKREEAAHEAFKKRILVK